MTNIFFVLPPRQEVRAAWLGAELAKKPSKWTITLSPTHITELEQAKDTIVADGIELRDISPKNFRLPTLGPILSDIQQELIGGLGFALICGLDAENYSEEEVGIMFYGLGSLIGHARSQNAKGDVLGHVKDVGADGADHNVRIYQTNERQTFHTDSSDVVGLVCLKQAEKGGDTIVVSALSIYNAFLEKRPDLLPYLFDPIATDRRGEVPKGMKPFFEIPVYTWHQEYMNVMYQRQYIDSAQRFPQAMELTPGHIEALDLFDQLANDPTLVPCLSG